MEWMVQAWEQLGATAAMMLTITYLFICDKKASHKDRDEHRKERAEWRTSAVQMHSENVNALSVVRESNERIQDRNIEAMGDLKSMNREIHNENLKAIEQLTDAIISSNKNKSDDVQYLKDK